MSPNKYAGYRYHKTDHQKLCGNMTFMVADLNVWGVVMGLRLMAGRTRQEKGNTDGALEAGSSYPAKERDILDWVESKGLSKKQAQGAWEGVKKAGIVKVSRAGVVRIADWKAEQEMPSTENTKHQRDRRERKTLQDAARKLGPWVGKTLSEDELVRVVRVLLNKRSDTARRICERLVDLRFAMREENGDIKLTNESGFYKPCPPSSPSPTGNDNPSTDNPDMSGTEPDMSGDIDSRQKTKTTVSLTTCQSATEGEEGGQGLYAMLQQDPVRAACYVTGSFSQSNQRIFGAKLRDYRLRFNGSGQRKFCSVVETLAAELQQGEHGQLKTQGDLPRFLTSRLKKFLEPARKKE